MTTHPPNLQILLKQSQKSSEQESWKTLYYIAQQWRKKKISICLLNILSAMSGTQISPAATTTYISSCSSKASQPHACIVSHSGWGHHRLGHHSRSPSQRVAAMRDTGVQSVVLGNRGTLAVSRLRGLWMGWRKIGMDLETSLSSSGFFNFFSQFYTPQI